MVIDIQPMVKPAWWFLATGCFPSNDEIWNLGYDPNWPGPVGAWLDCWESIRYGDYD